MTKTLDIINKKSKVIEKPLEKEVNFEDVERETLPDDLKFIIISNFGELLDVAIQLEKVERYEILFCVTDKNYSKIGEGIVSKTDDWHRCIGKGYIWVVDGCEHADLQDWLRDQGEYVVGTNKELSDMENDRQKGQEWFKEAGFKQPFSKNFKDIKECIEFVKENSDKRWILKQNGDAPKSINHKGHFDGNEDMIFHLEECEKSWNTAEYGDFDCDLMEVVEGLEVAVSAFFNGHDWLRDDNGKVVAYLNFEHKKETEGDGGETTGEMGTLFFGANEDHNLVKDILLREEIEKKLKDTSYRGVFDLNGCWTKDGYVVFEATSRFGVPATSYEFIEGLETKTGEVLASMAMGIDTPIKIWEGWGLCQVIVAKPFPVESDLMDDATSRDEKLWIVRGEKPVDDFNKSQLTHIHLENFFKKEGDYRVATKNGYLLVATKKGDSIEKIREDLIEYIKENIYISGMKYRTDLGKRIEENEKDIENNEL